MHVGLVKLIFTNQLIAEPNSAEFKAADLPDI